MTSARDKALEIIRSLGGHLKMKDALDAGITRYMLYALRDEGILVQVSRGLYRLKELPPMSHPDLVTVSLRIPKGIICLISALDFHNLTSQVPHAVSIALPRGSRTPSLNHPPVQVFEYSPEPYASGIGEHLIDGAVIKIYGPEKTLADCFKFRNTLGMDIVLEALRLYQAPGYPHDYHKLMEYASICRVEQVMRPYLEAGS